MQTRSAMQKTKPEAEPEVMPCFAKLTDYHLFKYVKSQGVDARYLESSYIRAVLRAVARENSRKIQYSIIRDFSGRIKNIRAETPNHVFANFVAALPDYFESVQSD